MASRPVKLSYPGPFNQGKETGAINALEGAGLVYVGRESLPDEQVLHFLFPGQIDDNTDPLHIEVSYNRFENQVIDDTLTTLATNAGLVKTASYYQPGENVRVLIFDKEG